MNKKKVVEKILNKLSEKFPDIRPIKKDFLQSIMNIMTSRNKLAHGEIIIDINLNEAFLRYYESGYKEIKMTPDFFKKFDKWVSDVIKIYWTRIVPKVITSDNPIQYLQ
jgi:hypothetical protein